MGIKTDQIRDMLCQAGGAAFSNTYKVSFVEDQRQSKNENKVFANLKNDLGPTFIKSELQGDTAGGGVARWISLMCDEAVLPGSQIATGQVNGIYTGSGQFNYAHTRMYNDLTLSWIGDANMTALKFLNSWMDTIFVQTNGRGTEYKTINQTNFSDVQYRDRNRAVRLNYPDEYTMQISVLKGEKDKNSEVGRASVRYVMEGAFPYAVDSIPVSFGTTTLMKITANFYYERWYMYYTNQWGKDKV